MEEVQFSEDRDNPHWIHVKEVNQAYVRGYKILPNCRCSVCGFYSNSPKTKCPHCGTEMTGKPE